MLGLEAVTEIELSDFGGGVEVVVDPQPAIEIKANGRAK
jgi:hypothetical protein